MSDKYDEMAENQSLRKELAAKSELAKAMSDLNHSRFNHGESLKHTRMVEAELAQTKEELAAGGGEENMSANGRKRPSSDMHHRYLRLEGTNADLTNEIGRLTTRISVLEAELARTKEEVAALRSALAASEQRVKELLLESEASVLEAGQNALSETALREELASWKDSTTRQENNTIRWMLDYAKLDDKFQELVGENLALTAQVKGLKKAATMLCEGHCPDCKLDYFLSLPASHWQDKVERMEKALKHIASIENKTDGGDWDEIEIARKIALAAIDGTGEVTT